jgi:hypothetical protein
MRRIELDVFRDVENWFEPSGHRESLAPRPYKELDFSGEESVHADVVGGL